ncbi:hypothetical protein [Haliangium sp.]|uniref:hypothetical protein n=1 Tax=Haliangium sp. TaxID=2663208 RepID=UPI003D11E46E
MSGRTTALALVAVCCLSQATWSRPTHAGDDRTEPAEPAARVVLVSFPPGLDDATRTALGPWRLVVLRESQPLPSGDGDAVAAASVAERRGADAVIWLSTGRDDARLRIYERSRGRVLSRPLPSLPPFDEPTAASVALTIKTLMRHSELAPAAERVTTPPAAEVFVLPPRPPRYTAEARVRLNAAWPAPAMDDALFVEPRLTVGLSWWPDWLSGSYGVGLRAGMGTGASVAKSSFRGRLDDLALALDLRSRVWSRGRIRIELAAGPGLHITRLDGTLQSTREAVQQHRLRPSLELGASVHLRLHRLISVGLTLDAALVGRRDTYEVAMANPGQPNDRDVARAPGLITGFGVTLYVHP